MARFHPAGKHQHRRGHRSTCNPLSCPTRDVPDLWRVRKSTTTRASRITTKNSPHYNPRLARPSAWAGPTAHGTRGRQNVYTICSTGPGTQKRERAPCSRMGRFIAPRMFSICEQQVAAAGKRTKLLCGGPSFFVRNLCDVLAHTNIHTYTQSLGKPRSISTRVVL